MDFLMENKIFLMYGVVVVVFMLVGMVIRNKQVKKTNKNSKEQYLGRYPDASKVILTQGGFITSEAVQVVSVNDEYPANFVENGDSGFYVKPGANIIEVDYTYTRPGVMYKTVTKSTGVVKQEIEVEPRKVYKLGFDRKEEQFTFEELSLEEEPVLD